MIRIALHAAVLSLAAASLLTAGCSSQAPSEPVDQQRDALSGADAIDDGSAPCDPADSNCKCDPSDPKCATPPCDPSDPKCATDPPCDPADSNCPKQPPCDPNDPKCAPPCPDGDPDCAKVPPGGGYDCAAVGKELALLLAEAQACNVAGMGMKAQCATFVPTTNGCEAPVADPNAAVTQKYLAIWKEYAASCPLPLPACPDPKLLTTACTQDANVDSLVGACAVVAAQPGAKAAD